MGTYYNYDASGERNLKLTGGTVDVADEPVFFYHSDHLGSASYITDNLGNETQHLVYLPFGEDWVDWKYNTSQFETPFKFNGKEKDPETGYNYYGARYLSTDLSIWLSVDPMSDKYPHLTSYNYCANNPVMLIDPDGREIFITGEASDKAVEQLQNKSKLKLSRDSETGKLSSKGFAWTKSDRALKEAIKDKKTKVNITAKNDNLISTDGNGHESRSKYGGSYMGNTLSEDGKSVSTSQFVVPDLLGAKDREVGDKIAGGYMLHEVMESYYGGKIALEPGGYSSPKAGDPGSTYNLAHGMANDISKGGWQDVYGSKITNIGFGAYEKLGIRYNKEYVKIGTRRCN